MLANHTYSADAPESGAVRQALIFFAIAFTFLGLFFYFAGANVQEHPSDATGSAKDGSSHRSDVDPLHHGQTPTNRSDNAKLSDPREAPATLAARAAFQENKPVGSIFSEPSSRSQTAQVSSRNQPPAVASQRIAKAP